MKISAGNCITGLENEAFCNLVAEDATELAQLIDNSIEISYLDLCKELDLKLFSNHSNYQYLKNMDRDIIIIYDNEKDVHTFFIEV